MEPIKSPTLWFVRKKNIYLRDFRSERKTQFQYAAIAITEELEMATFAVSYYRSQVPTIGIC